MMGKLYLMAGIGGVDAATATGLIVVRTPIDLMTIHK
jgi:hypothetical protein